MVPVRPRRSVLYVPGSNARALEKARTLPADGLILDLEDAVAPAAKEEARARGRWRRSRAGGFGHREVVGARERARDAVGRGRPRRRRRAPARTRSCCPRSSRAAEVRAAERGARGRAARPPGLALWCMIETPRGVLAAPRSRPPRRASPASSRGRATS